ncbi:exodeoxyribonuclease VII large subunit [Methylocapsa palsarum]|uniref:Exodeoxyribonuclease 7 large subunit n=1 Tax=Methylocapsa palsarum TaxID=1612308 RepID=A0A1I3WXD3_9HYPH|nr:exodeoxyribonuclease VII large subunit [Methylocapsa palsarum]SFK12010.1 exodeoxyribonuclease VII large subunit [Methylocapsa palsarum]
MAEIAATNAPELSVSELSLALKRTIEDRFGLVRVRGEISNYRGPHSSGHAYFCLKDQAARIDAVIWKGVFTRLKTKPQEGLEVVATGKITTFPGKSNYQIVIDSIEPAGIGALMALFEERRRKLAAEGLFDEARKQLVPFLPRSIGVVTSPTGAVIRDILHRIAERFPLRVLVWPVRVQGDASAEEVAAAIDGFNALPEDGPLRRPDVLIVARGGGSLEDLWSFNEEIVVRAAARSHLAIISAIGHETDWTLLDLAADLRAPTPTAAAEKAVPVRSELAAAVSDLGRRHSSAAFRLLERCRNDLRGLLRALPHAEALLALPRQRVDHAASRFSNALSRSQDRRRIALANLSHRLAQQSPHARMGRAEEQLGAMKARLARAAGLNLQRASDLLHRTQSRLSIARSAQNRMHRERAEAARLRLGALSGRMDQAAAARIAVQRAKVASLGQLLSSLGYRQVLARGFALVRDAEQRPLRLASEIADGARIEIEFHDGRKEAVAGGAGKAPLAKPSRKPKTQKDQETLF